MKVFVLSLLPPTNSWQFLCQRHFSLLIFKFIFPRWLYMNLFLLQFLITFFSSWKTNPLIMLNAIKNNTVDVLLISVFVRRISGHFSAAAKITFPVQQVNHSCPVNPRLEFKLSYFHAALFEGVINNPHSCHSILFPVLGQWVDSYKTCRIFMLHFFRE